MIIHYDPDDYTVETKSSICMYHQQHPGENYAGCSCFFSVMSKKKEKTINYVVIPMESRNE